MIETADFSRRLGRLFAAAGMAGGLSLLSACALLSTPDPVQMYRFGPLDAAYVGPRDAEAVQVSLRRVQFPDAVASDRLLAVTGHEASYIAGARWVSGARLLYVNSLEAAFSAEAGGVRLIGGRELTRSGVALDVDVTTFETRYDAPGAVPRVVMTARVRLLAMPGRTATAEEVFSVSMPARENRIGAIVEAYDLAAQALNAEIVEWTVRHAPEAASRPSRRP